MDIRSFFKQPEIPAKIVKNTQIDLVNPKFVKKNKIQYNYPRHYALLKQDNRDLNELNTLLQLSKCMGGIDMRRHTDTLNFQKDTPEIELCDIFSFLNTITNQRSNDYDSVVYINICQNSKWYVGISGFREDISEEKYKNYMIKRLASHRNNGGCNGCPTNWTWVYPVVSTVIYIKGNETDECLVTQLMAKCVGIDNVRGGDWTNIHGPPIFPNMTLQEIKDAITNNNK